MSVSSLDDFDYTLPAAQIASRPSPRRADSRLLDARDGLPHISSFQKLPDLLRAGDLIVVNDSKVIPARLCGNKPSGGQTEIFAERFLTNGEVIAQIRASKPPPLNSEIEANGRFIVREKMSDGFYRLQAVNRRGQSVNARSRFLRYGQTPLPPYIRRPPDKQDKRRYQTVFARYAGSVAAPTAGLHFSTGLLTTMAARNIQITAITLHVGAGTFLPLRDGLSATRLHPERYHISAAAAAAIAAAQQRGGRIVAVGTTTLRALEAANGKNGVCAADTETDLFIKPGHQFGVADLLLTNFHLPRSSLLILTCAFGGRAKVLSAYQFALANKLRFYSYGDAMLLSRASSA